jgi:A1 cistron-splicing factor AAR2
MERLSDYPEKNVTGRIPDMESDDAFCVTPLSANASDIDQSATPTNATFMQNHASIQRSSSTTISQASALSRTLSTKSTGSLEPTPTPPTITGILEDDERTGRGRARGTSTSSLIDATSAVTLNKSPSTSSGKSVASVKSTKSVRSVTAVGSYPLGSLRIHSPSPTREAPESHKFLKSGDALVIRDMPIGALFGYDTRGFSINAEEPFEGLRSIPPGAHLVWGGANHQSLRTGFWIMTSKKTSEELGEILVKRWDKESECLEEVSHSYSSHFTILLKDSL